MPPDLNEMVEIAIGMTQFERPGFGLPGRLCRLGPNGVEVDLERPPEKRFSWLEFELPESGYRVKALGEVAWAASGLGGYKVIYRFKHLFPRDRMALESYLSRRAAA